MKIRFKQIFASFLALILMLVVFTGCSNAPAPSASPSAAPSASAAPAPSPEPSEPAEQPLVRVAALAGPTGIGMVKLMQDNEDKTTANRYEFSISSSPDDIVGKITTGEADVAAVPTNLASVLYNKTSGNVQIAAINTLGVLYILEKGESISSVEDLRGKTIYASGKGATPEFALNFILSANGLEPGKDVTVEYKAEHAELATIAVSGSADIVLLPEPFVTTTLGKSQDLRIALDLTEEWEKAAQKAGKAQSAMAMGCIIVRKQFADENKAAFDAFLAEYKASAEYAVSDVPEAAKLVEKYKIVASAALAEKAIPNCNIVYIDGAEMKAALEGFYNVLFEADPKSVGGKLPNEDFYYRK